MAAEYKYTSGSITGSGVQVAAEYKYTPGSISGSRV